MTHWPILSLFPKDASAVGFEVDKLFYLALLLTTIAFVIVLTILVYFLIRYRAKPGHKSVYMKGESPKARLLTLGLALIVFVGIDINLAVHDHHAWEHLLGRPASTAQPLRVEIMPQQFAWNIRYAGPDGEFQTNDDITTVNNMHIPIDQPVIVQLRSKDVIHSFFIPNFRVKQDALPGMITMLTFQAKQPGVFDIACAEHCGLGHYRMRGMLTVEPPAAFDAFLLKTGTAQAPDSSWGWKWVS